ncbi:MAG: MerR family transcriptional regulator [Pseudomonadota bacterium]
MADAADRLGQGKTQKSPDAFRTISEVASELDLPQHVLRFWETRFNQIKPLKRGGGRRLYRPDHVALLRGIRALLYDDGMTIKGVQKVLREKGIKTVIARGEAGASLDLATPGDTAARLAALKDRVGSEAAVAAPIDSERVQASITRLEALLERLEGDRE